MIFKALQLLGVNTAGYNRAMWHFAGLKTSHGILVCFVITALFLASAYFMVKPLASAGKRITILCLHVLALAFAILIFLEPELRLASAQGVKSPIAIVIDGSQSMSVSSTSGKTRVQTATDWIAKNQSFFNSLATDYEIKWFSFDEALHALPANFLDSKDLKASGTDTKILESLPQLRKELNNKPLSGLVLISDGADRGELGRAGSLKPEEKKKFQQDLKKSLAGMGRIFPVLAGSADQLKDLSIVKLENDSYGFIKSPFVVTATVRALGDLPKQTSISLFQEDKLLATKPLTLGPGKDQKVELEFTPLEVGRFLFRVETPAFQGEASAENNRRTFPLTIIRDRIRALYIVGNPSWDEKFLRETLRKNPAVDLVSFYILREYWDDPHASEEELALIPFPTHKLFTDELSSFDLVIFQNFFGQPYMLPAYISNLKDYVVDKGGALVYIGGPRSFMKSDFEMPLEAILPVDYSFAVPNYKPAKFKLHLTAAGARHPITRLEADDGQNQKLWDSLGEFDGYNQILRPKPDAQVLVDAKGGESSAMIAVREAGKGRVISIATDDLWRWHFQAEGLGQTAKYYQLFWERALRWLMRDPEMKPVSLASVKENYKPGEEISLFFNVQDNSYEPVSGATVTLETIKAPENCAIAKQPGAEISPGKYQFQFKLDCPGGYRFQAGAVKAGASLGTDQEILVASADSAEMDDLSLHPELLQMLADATGGKLLNPDQSADKMKFDKLKLEEITSATDIPVWTNWFCWSCLVLVFGLTWGLRRYWGLS